MKKFAIMMLILALGASYMFVHSEGNRADDKKAVEAAALDYIEGWYSGNPERMERALHDDLAKRGMYPDRETGKIVMQPVSKEQLVDYAKRGVGKKPKEEWAVKVTILDMLNYCATVKIESVSFIDYLHVAKLGDEWKIVNVLWEFQPRE